ncbi:hypothetical protein ScPMuIL_016623 [Solemya velum]
MFSSTVLTAITVCALDPTICYNTTGYSVNGMTYEYFTCPYSGQPASYTYCCGTPGQQQCCDTCCSTGYVAANSSRTLEHQRFFHWLLWALGITSVLKTSLTPRTVGYSLFAPSKTVSLWRPKRDARARAAETSSPSCCSSGTRHRYFCITLTLACLISRPFRHVGKAVGRLIIRLEIPDA